MARLIRTTLLVLAAVIVLGICINADTTIGGGQAATKAAGRIFDTVGIAAIKPPVKISVDIPAGWDVQEKRDQFQLIINTSKRGDPVHVEIWVKAADAAKADKWLKEKDVFSTELGFKDSTRDGMQIRRVMAADKYNPGLQQVLWRFAKPPYFFMVNGGGTAQAYMQAYIAAADAIAASLKIVP